MHERGSGRPGLVGVRAGCGMNAILRRRSWPSAVTLGAALVGCPLTWAQTPDFRGETHAFEPLIKGLDLADFSASPCKPARLAHHPARFRLFLSQPAFAWAPAGLDEQDAPQVEPDGTIIFDNKDSGGLHVTLGMANPYFDFQQRGTPTAFGFYQLYAQYTLIDTGATALGLVLEGRRPPGWRVTE